MSKTTKRTYATESKMAVALEVVRGEKTISQVASERDDSPSLVCEWRDQLVGSADDVFGRTRQDRERRRSEEAARRQYDDALRTIGQPAVERDFLFSSEAYVSLLRSHGIHQPMDGRRR